MMNISEIATLAGVSRATVSRYLNDGYVSEEKKERIKKVIEETGYVPSAQAQNLRTKKTKLIGVILPKISSESISKVVDGISAEITHAGYHLLLANTDNSIEKELEYLKIFQKNQVDGVIFIATMLTMKHKRLMKELTVPVVVVGQEVAGYCSVYHDDFGAAKEITKHLVAHECKAIAYIGVSEQDKAAGLERKKGFYSAIEEAEKQHNYIDVITLEEGDFSIDSGFVLMQKVLASGKAVDGVFCATDSIAVGAMEAIKMAGKSIPGDIAIVGMGGNRLASVVTPKLTTVKYAYEASGRDAATILLALMCKNTDINKKIKLSYKIMVQETTYST